MWQAIRQLAAEPWVTLRLSALPFLAALIATVGLLWLVVPGQVSETVHAGPLTLHGRAIFSALLPILVFWCFALLWVAVGWHRHVLLDERPLAAMPRLHAGRMLAYLGWGLLILVTGALLAWPSFFVATIFVKGVLGGGGPAPMTGRIAFVFVLLWLLRTVFMWLFYRVAPLLPAVACGRKMNIGDAWHETRNAGGTLFVLAVLTFLADFLLNLPAGLALHGIAASAEELWAVLVLWLETMFGLSILTTIYGHYIEKRPLVGAAPKA